MKKIPLLIIVLFITALAVFASGEKEVGTKPDQTEKVELVMYLLGDSQPDYDRMLSIVNTKLEEDINA
ncbi:MAG: hypothetical protein ACLFST_08895, partial [Spirochaetia bacterium]